MIQFSPEHSEFVTDFALLTNKQFVSSTQTSGSDAFKIWTTEFIETSLQITEVGTFSTERDLKIPADYYHKITSMAKVFEAISNDDVYLAVGTDYGTLQIIKIQIQTTKVRNTSSCEITINYCFVYFFPKNKLEEFGFFELMYDEGNEVSEIISYGSAGNFVAAIEEHLFFFKLDGVYSLLDSKYDVHSNLITLLIPMSDTYMVTGDKDGDIYVWKRTENTEFSVHSRHQAGYPIRAGIKCTDLTFYIVSEILRGEEFVLEKYDLVMNHYGSSKIFDRSINAITIHGQSVVIGLESGLITS